MKNLKKIDEAVGTILERRASAETLLKAVVKGNTTEAEGIALSKQMAQGFLDWLQYSTYGKRFGALPFYKLFSAAFDWGLDRYVKGANTEVKGEFKELKAKAKKMSKAERVNESEVTEGNKFKPGDKWSNDFDYDGMLAYALKVNHKTPLKTLQKLHDSATDVNYHTPFAGLGNAIDWITDDGVNSKEGKDFIKQFHKDIKDELKESVVNEDSKMKNFKTYGQFISEAYSDEERKELADKGFALSDGSFPIKDLKDLKNAIQAYGRAKDQARAAKFIAKRAKALGAEDLIPDTEDFQKSLSESVNEYGPMRGSGNRNYSTNDLVDRIGDLDDILMSDRKAEREWEEMSQNYLDGERGSEYWGDLGDQELQDAIDGAESLMKKYRIKESVVTEGLDKNKPYFDFLVALRDSGATNMFGATPYLQDAFGLSKSEARKILAEWMKSFNEGKLTEGKDDYVARFKDTNIFLKKGYKHLNDEELNQLYLEIGELISDNKLKVKNATLQFESASKHVGSAIHDVSTELPAKAIALPLEDDEDENGSITEGTDIGSWNQGGLKGDKNVLVTTFVGPKGIEDFGLGRKCMQINVGMDYISLNPADIVELKDLLKSYKVK